ncbi:MAG: hypothetical protein VR70_07345 [Rhodospirillaceae bacterium BRH_c57]|nr:MAG: hypothetical protein VR70_07345 [Rhodospirillaceae bacterium BRH_c57]
MSRRVSPAEGFHLDLLGPLISEQPVTDISAGTLLFSQGEEADRFFVLLEGRVKLYTASPSGAENIMQVFGPGDFFGLPAMLSLKSYPVNGEAVAASRLIVMHRTVVLEWLRATPDQVPHLLALLGRRYERMLDSLAAFKVLSPRARLCRYLLEAAAEAGPLPDAGPVSFALPLPAHMIGGRIGLAPENVSRAFRWLGSHGVSVSQGVVKAADVAVVRQMAGQ